MAEGDKATSRAQQHDAKDQAAPRAQQQGSNAYASGTGEQQDDQIASAGITIWPGQEVDSIRVRVPGMDEFETGPQQLRDWLREHKLVPTQRQLDEIEQQITDALVGHTQKPHGNHPGAGSYESDGYRAGSTEVDRDRIDETRTEDWTRMVNAWEQFHQQVQDLHSIAGGEQNEILRQVAHTITALNMVENTDWAPPYSAEIDEWQRLSADGLTPETVHAAAQAIVQAGETLHHQWQDTRSAGNYDYHTLTRAQHEFVQHCEDARKAMVF
jgi:hypothetical protein